MQKQSALLNILNIQIYICKYIFIPLIYIFSNKEVGGVVELLLCFGGALPLWSLGSSALHKDGLSYKKIAKTLKLSCSTMAKTIQWFNRTGSTQNSPRHGRPKKLSTLAQRYIQRLCLGNRRMSAASIAAEVEGVGGQPVSAQTVCHTLHQIVCMAVVPEGSFF